jgi:hypothetical protein
MVAYVLPNYRSRRALINGLTEGMAVKVFAFDPEPPWNGPVTVEGPNYPEVPQWRARVRIENGVVKQILPDN